MHWAVFIFLHKLYKHPFDKDVNFINTHFDIDIDFTNTHLSINTVLKINAKNGLWNELKETKDLDTRKQFCIVISSHNKLKNE